MIQIDRIDHIVINVNDMDEAIAFYTKVMGMELETFGAGRKAMKFGRQKINLHQYGKEFKPNAHLPVPGSADLCFIAATPLDEFMDHLRACGVEIMEGPVPRTGATGAMQSVYFRDPDLNLIEVSNYLN